MEAQSVAVPAGYHRETIADWFGVAAYLTIEDRGFLWSKASDGSPVVNVLDRTRC